VPNSSSRKQIIGYGLKATVLLLYYYCDVNGYTGAPKSSPLKKYREFSKFV